MAAFKPFETTKMSVEKTIHDWKWLNPQPYDKYSVHPYTRCRVILMNGIENNSVIISHNISRLAANDQAKRALAMIRRSDSQHQQFINWLNPANQTVLETTIGYEQVAVDLTSDLAQNEPDQYFKQVLDFALLEDFDHLFRYGCLLELLEGMDPNQLTGGFTEIKPGRPTVDEHRHPDDERRKPYDKNRATLKTKMNYNTIVSGEQQTMLFYKAHGMQYANPLARGIYTEIAEIEQQHVSQYEDGGDPTETALEKLTLMQICEAYNYFSAMETEVDPRFKKIWEQMYEQEMAHVQACLQLVQMIEGRDLRESLGEDTIEPLIVFHENIDYVNKILASQVDLRPINMEFVPLSKLPRTWASFGYANLVNDEWVPSEVVTEEAERKSKIPAESRQMKPGGADIYERLKQDHLEVKQMLERLNGGDGSAEPTFEQLFQELTAHSRAEEKVLYETLKKQESSKEVALEGYEEHHASDTFLAEMAKGKAGSDEWKAKAKVLMEVVEHHVTDEEGELFQKAREVIDEKQAREMVGRFEKEKESIMRQGVSATKVAKMPASQQKSEKGQAARTTRRKKAA